MNVDFLTKSVVFARDANDAVAGTTAVTSAAAIPVAGYDGVTYIAATGDVTSGSVLTLTVYGTTTTTASGGTSIASATYTSASSTDADNKLITVDVVRPAYAYTYATLTRTTQNAVVDGIFSARYKARTQPVTADSSVIASAVSVTN